MNISKKVSLGLLAIGACVFSAVGYVQNGVSGFLAVTGLFLVVGSAAFLIASSDD